MTANSACCDDSASSEEIFTGNVGPILNEIRHALKKLLEDGVLPNRWLK